MSREKFDYREELPTVSEMRRVARYLDMVLGLHSCAGKLLIASNQLELREKIVKEANDKL